MLRVLKSVRAICKFCRTPGRCYEVESEDESLKGDHCIKCIDRWLDARSDYKPKKKDKGGANGELTEAAK